MKSSFVRHFFSGPLNIFSSLAASVVVSLLVTCTPQDSSQKFGLKLFVSTTGNDSWSGKLNQPNLENTDGPFATLWGARDAIRELKKNGKLPKGNVIVEIQGGVYELPGTAEEAWSFFSTTSRCGFRGTRTSALLRSRGCITFCPWISVGPKVIRWESSTMTTQGYLCGKMKKMHGFTGIGSGTGVRSGTRSGTLIPSIKLMTSITLPGSREYIIPAFPCMESATGQHTI
jgi:hypothetical protein